MSTAPRSVFFVSDRTGLTSENMGNALLEQFSELAFKRSTHPFIDSPEKPHAQALARALSASWNKS